MHFPALSEEEAADLIGTGADATTLSRRCGKERRNSAGRSIRDLVSADAQVARAVASLAMDHNPLCRFHPKPN
jgi:hypothetical protein